MYTHSNTADGKWDDSRHGYIHSSLCIRGFRSGTPPANVRYRAAHEKKPSHMWCISKHNGRMLKHTWLLVILTSASSYTTFFCEKEQIATRNSRIAVWWGEWTGYGVFFPINPCCKSRFDRRVRASSTVRQRHRPPAVKHQALVNIYIASPSPPLPSAGLLAKYVFTWEINRGENETIQGV